MRLARGARIRSIRYLGDLEACGQMLAVNPATPLGKWTVCSFYREEAGGILVSLFLHQRMLPERHSLDDDA
jgi:hypothetical protein